MPCLCHGWVLLILPCHIHQVFLQKMLTPPIGIEKERGLGFDSRPDAWLKHQSSQMDTSIIATLNKKHNWKSWIYVHIYNYLYLYIYTIRTILYILIQMETQGK